MTKISVLLLLLLSSMPLSADDWNANGHDAGGTKYSPLTQITPQNITRLQVAWTYRTGDLYQPEGGGVPLRSKRCLFTSTTLCT